MNYPKIIIIQKLALIPDPAQIFVTIRSVTLYLSTARPPEQAPTLGAGKLKFSLPPVGNKNKIYQ
jgi:hypothetical protein